MMLVQQSSPLEMYSQQSSSDEDEEMSERHNGIDMR